MIESDELLATLDQRLTAVAKVLFPDLAVADDTPGTATSNLLPRLVAASARVDAEDVRWLVLTALFGAFPTIGQVKQFGRMVELDELHIAESNLLAQVISTPSRGRLDLPIRIVTDGVVVDVNSCATRGSHTGIHRVVRETLPRWSAQHDLTLVAWDSKANTFRTLAPSEKARVLEHRDHASHANRALDKAHQSELIVPWRSTVVEAEVPNKRYAPQLAALANLSGNSLSLIAYDIIPITTPELRPPIDIAVSSAYLTVVKHADRAAAISQSTVAEFNGITHALQAQGLVGPLVREVRLPDESLKATASVTSRTKSRPVMLCLGTQEPHKNQRAALHAAERLWREGLKFEVRLAGGKGWSDTVLQPAITKLVKARRSISPLGRVSDAELLNEMSSADFVYFASLHEGYGLPIAEALTCGTPVITSNFGSQAEIAALGGCITVDPRDDDDIANAIRTLLTQPETLAKLRAEASTRPVRTWDDYAVDLWNFLVEKKDPTRAAGTA